MKEIVALLAVRGTATYGVNFAINPEKIFYDRGDLTECRRCARYGGASRGGGSLFHYPGENGEGCDSSVFNEPRFQELFTAATSGAIYDVALPRLFHTGPFPIDKSAVLPRDLDELALFERVPLRRSARGIDRDEQR